MWHLKTVVSQFVFRIISVRLMRVATLKGARDQIQRTKNEQKIFSVCRNVYFYTPDH